MREENPEPGTQHPVPGKIGRFFAYMKKSFRLEPETKIT